MKKVFTLLLFAFLYSSSGKACNAFFTHSYACAGDTIFFYANDQFGVYTWDFGDTASGVANVSHDTDTYHIYMNPGTYYVTLFVNIGAEWDYKTQIIHVGTDCSNIEFSYVCTGVLNLSFINESTSDYTMTTWYFGDTASASADTSTSPNASHIFSSPGTYNVTLITSDGIFSDTLVKSVVADSSCTTPLFLNNFSGDCIQDTTKILVAYYGHPVSYWWDFGDTLSGTNNNSTDSLGIHQYSAAGIYLVTLAVTDSFQTDTFFTVENIIDCNVWPGNVNGDGVVNMEDLFAIGIYYGDTGIVRPSATTNWTGQSCPDWNINSMNYMYLQDLLDKKYADCNGDGRISSIDITSINQNYGLHPAVYFHNDEIQMMPVTAGDPILQVMVGLSLPWNGPADVSVPIDLSATDSVRSIYGLAARLYYDPSAIVPGSVTITFNNGWMGTNGIDLVGLIKDFYADGYIDFGMVRTDKNRITGNGTIAYLNFTLNHYLGVLNFNFDPVVRLITNGTFNNQEIFLPVSARSTQLNVISNSVESAANSNFSVYPNPANDVLNIISKENINIYSAILTDLTGRIIKEENNINGNKNFRMNCENVSSGIYILIANASTGKFAMKIEIRK